MRRELFSCLMMLIVGLTRTWATSAKRTRAPLGVSIGRLRMSVRLRRAFGRAPDVHVVRPSAPEDVAHFLARHEHRNRPPDVARLEPVAPAGGQVFLDLDLRNVVLELRVQLVQARYVLERVLHPVRLVAKRSQVVPEDAHDDRLGCRRQHLVDPLSQIGQQLPEDAGIGVHDLFELTDRLVVVGVLVDAEPALAEVRAHHLLRQEGLPDVGTEALDGRNRAEVLAALDHDSLLLGAGRAGRGRPVREDVPLLERRIQLLPEARHDRERRRTRAVPPRRLRATACGRWAARSAR